MRKNLEKGRSRVNAKGYQPEKGNYIVTMAVVGGVLVSGLFLFGLIRA